MSKSYIADKPTLDNVNEKVGTENDTPSSTPTTLFAGIKQLLNSLTAHVNNWTAARAGYIDKLNNGTYGLEAIKNAINAVANSAGKCYTPSDTVIANIGDANAFTLNSTSSSFRYGGGKITNNFMPKASGIVRIKIPYTVTRGDTSEQAASISFTAVSLGQGQPELTNGSMADVFRSTQISTKGINHVIKNNTTSSFYIAGSITDIEDCEINPFPKEDTTTETKSGTAIIEIAVTQGFPVYVILKMSGYYNARTTVDPGQVQVCGTLNTL